MKIANSITEYAALRSTLDEHAERRVVYVPTMGALHDGHRSLIKLGRSLGDVVVVSIFVNPLQFGPGEDYARYPRRLEDDLQVCEADGVDIVFVPSVSDLYPAGRQVTVDAGALGSVFEGASRPGHFNGMLTVVLKLFNLIRPHVAVLGEMVTDLNLAIAIVGAPIVREPDGLALSSRNIFLTVSERAVARSLSAALEKAATQSSVPAARAAAHEVLDRAEAEPSFELDYATIVNPSTFAEVPDDHVGLATFVVAARVGGTRLIDNTTINFAPAPWA